MEARGLSAALIHKPQNMRYLTGFTGEGCLFVSAQRQAVLTDFRYVEQLSRQAPALECVRTRMGKSVETLAAELAADAGARTLAVETDFLCYDDWAALQAALGDVSLTPLAGLVEEMRLVKDEGEIDCIRRAVRALKNANCRRIDGAFPVIIHPDVAYDLMNDPKWLAPHQYVDTEHMYEGEIGKIEGCRFVESTEAKIFHAADLAGDSRTLLTAGAVSGKTTFPFDGGTVQAGALVGRQVLIGNACVTVTANTASSMTVDAAVTAEDNAIIYPGEAGAQGRDVYVTLVLGADGYGTTEITGGGLEHIVKQLGSAGTGDPLNQRASVGWKATKVAVRLDDSAIRRIETCSTYTE